MSFSGLLISKKHLSQTYVIVVPLHSFQSFWQDYHGIKHSQKDCVTEKCTCVVRETRGEIPHKDSIHYIKSENYHRLPYYKQEKKNTRAQIKY